MLCYRYFKFDDAKESLNDGWYKTSKPSEFNDPFDCRANFVGEPSDRVLGEYIDRNFKWIRELAIQTNPIWASVSIDRNFVLAKLRASINWAKDATRTMREGADAIVRIMCFSRAAVENEVADNLMWAHYADKGTGVRIGFDFNDANNHRAYHLEAVHYDSAMPTIDLSKVNQWPIDNSEVSKFFAKCLCAKDSSWKYEDEVRMIIPRTAPKIAPMFQERLVKGVKMDFVHFSYAAIRSVDFGVRADIDQCKKLMAAIRGKEDARHISFRRAEYRDDIYGYKFVEL